mgnify:CR=1 FL=1
MTKIAAAVAACAIASSAGFAASVLSEWNVIVRNNIHGTSEVDGSALVGGNVTGATNYAVQGVTASNGDGLALGGNIAAGINVQINNGGNLRIAGSVLGNANINGGMQINDAGVHSMVTNALNSVVALQSSLRNLASNSTLGNGGNLNANPVVMDGFKVAVFSITASDLNGLGQLNLNMNGADTVIINVGADQNGVVSFNAPPNFVGGLTQSNSAKILWNLYDASKVIVNNNFNGSILAADADLELIGGGINGAVVVDNISKLNAEIRRNTYNGWLPPPEEDDTPIVPLPGAGALGVAGLAIVGARRRRSC